MNSMKGLSCVINICDKNVRQKNFSVTFIIPENLEKTAITLSSATSQKGTWGNTDQKKNVTILILSAN